MESLTKALAALQVLELEMRNEAQILWAGRVAAISKDIQAALDQYETEQQRIDSLIASLDALTDAWKL